MRAGAVALTCGGRVASTTMLLTVAVFFILVAGIELTTHSIGTPAPRHTTAQRVDPLAHERARTRDHTGRHRAQHQAAEIRHTRDGERTADAIRKRHQPQEQRPPRRARESDGRAEGGTEEYDGNDDDDAADKFAQSEEMEERDVVSVPSPVPPSPAPPQPAPASVSASASAPAPQPPPAPAPAPPAALLEPKTAPPPSPLGTVALVGQRVFFRVSADGRRVSPHVGIVPGVEGISQQFGYSVSCHSPEGVVVHVDVSGEPLAPPPSAEGGDVSLPPAPTVTLRRRAFTVLQFPDRDSNPLAEAKIGMGMVVLFYEGVGVSGGSECVFVCMRSAT
jgi:cell division protein FtsN